MGKPRTVRSFRHDPGDPIFAISYRWSRSRSPSQHIEIEFVRRLFVALESSVSGLVGAAPGQEIGFLDRQVISGGGQDPWPAAVRAAFARCQVLVPLLSPGYPKSSWCELEWKTFAGRRAFNRTTGRLTRDRSILPVLWIPGGPMPVYISKVSRFSPTNMPGSIEEHYLDEGLFGLAQLNEAELGPVTWRLARRIADCWNRTWTEPAKVDETAGGAPDDGADRGGAG